MKDKIFLLCGGSGMIGLALSRYLSEQGYRIRILTREKNKSIPYEQFIWDPYKDQLDTKALDEVYGIINLAGASIGNCRWSAKRKKELYDSRILSTKCIVKWMNTMDNPPKIFISTSGIGIYGNRGNVVVDENTPVDQADFLSDLCKDWEHEVSLVNKAIRTVIIRKGLVLSLEDGILAKSILPAKLGLCPIFGSGRQIYSWIHLEDLMHLYGWLIKLEDKSGIYNAVSSLPVSHATFAKLLSKSIYRFYLPFRIPAWLLHIIIGEFSTSLLSSQNVSNDKLISEGFKLKFPFLENAFQNLVHKN